MQKVRAAWSTKTLVVLLKFVLVLVFLCDKDFVRDISHFRAHIRYYQSMIVTGCLKCTRCCRFRKLNVLQILIPQTFVADAGHNYSAPYWMGEFGCGGDRLTCPYIPTFGQLATYAHIRSYMPLYGQLRPYMVAVLISIAFIAAPTGRKLFAS